MAKYDAFKKYVTFNLYLELIEKKVNGDWRPPTMRSRSELPKSTLGTPRSALGESRSTLGELRYAHRALEQQQEEVKNEEVCKENALDMAGLDFGDKAKLLMKKIPCHVRYA